VGRTREGTQGTKVLRLRPEDVMLAVALIAIPVATLLRNGARAGGPAAAYISQGGKLVEVVPLDRDRVFDFAAGKTRMKLEVKAGGIRVVESNCPKGLCCREGRIDRPGRPIVCVPNRVVIEVRGRKPDYDAETY
jgi:hypothetical protein